MNRFLLAASLLSLAIAIPAEVFAESDNPQKDFNPIPVASPTLMVAPDARSSGMGDVGVATTPDASSQHWNAAKYAFIDYKLGGVLGYSPWLRNLVPDVNIAYLSFFWKYRDIEAVAFTMRYFSLGSMAIVDITGMQTADASPYELALDVSWTRKFGDYFSAALTGRYIRSDLIGGVTPVESGYTMRPANAWAFDIGTYYRRPVRRDEILSFGLAMTNLGTKINYSDEASGYFLPMNMRFGASYGLPIDEDNRILFAVDFNKLLVPTPADRTVLNGDSSIVVNNARSSDVSVPLAIIQSFADAPFGFAEELAEINFGIGAEYCYRNTFFGRTGFYYDSRRKGNRRYMTFGAGLKYNFLQLDIAYYVPFTNNDPMANTVKFSLSMYLEESKYTPPSTGSRRRDPQQQPTTTTPRRTPSRGIGNAQRDPQEQDTTQTGNNMPADTSAAGQRGNVRQTPATQRGTTQQRTPTQPQRNQQTPARQQGTTPQRTTTPTRTTR